MQDRRRQTEDRRDRRYAADAVLPDARESEAYEFNVEIEDLIASGTQRWAEPLLRRMQAMIDRTQWVTTGHRQTLRRIRGATRPIHDWARKWPWPID